MKNSGLGQSGFHKSAAIAESFTWLESTASTNDDLAVLAREYRLRGVPAQQRNGPECAHQRDLADFVAA